MASRGSPSNKKNKRGVAAFDHLAACCLVGMATFRWCRRNFGVLGAGPLGERVASYAVRARGLLHKASVATASLLAGMTEPSSWDLSEAVVPRFPLQPFSSLL